MNREHEQEEAAQRPEMGHVWLKTRTGQQVVKVQIPLCSPPPDAIMWGERIFTRQIVAGAGRRYLEGTLWVVPVEEGEEDKT